MMIIFFIRHIIIVLLLFLSFNTVDGQINGKLPATNIYGNTFYIITDTLVGTAFIGGYNGKEYLISARHLFRSNLKDGDELIIYLKKQKGRVPYLSKVYTSNEDYDVVVIVPRNIPSLGYNYELGGSFSIGSTAYFLGFPYHSDYNTKIGSWNVPLVKSATISGEPTLDGRVVLILDGINNPGFSGGPVIAYDPDKDENTIIGVISGYRNQYNQVYVNEVKVDSLISIENSGLIYSTPIRKVVDIIKRIE